MASQPRRCQFSRRVSLRAAAGMGLAPWLSACATTATQRHPDDDGGAPWALPGRHPGDVVEVFHPASVVDAQIQKEAVKTAFTRGLLALTGAPDPVAAWRQLVSPGEVIGIKVNPVGASRAGNGRRVAITSPEMILTIVDGLHAAGIKPADIVLFDRYRNEFLNCGYHTLAARIGARWAASAVAFDETQIDLTGYSQGDPRMDAIHGAARKDGSPKVSGYDPDHFIDLAFIHPWHDPDDPRSRRSHVSRIVTKQVDKIINLCVLKDHGSAGVTGALKNLSHGLVDNVARTHASASLNQCRTFIPAIVAMPIIRRKVVLNVMEAFVGIYQGGPFASEHAWEPKSVLLATDPVALDRIAWDRLDEKRAQADLPSLSRAGLLWPGPQSKGDAEAFNRRQPEHVELAGVSGLGVFARDDADWKRLYGKHARPVRPIQTIKHQRIDCSEPV